MNETTQIAQRDTGEVARRNESNARQVGPQGDAVTVLDDVQSLSLIHI